MRDTAPVALLASTQHWLSPFQIGTHHIARAMERRGYRVGFVSAPLSPLHLLPNVGDDKRARFRSWRAGGAIDRASGVWHAVPMTLLPAAPAPLLGSAAVIRNAWRACVPPLSHLLRRGGFASPDVVLTDHFLHGIGLEHVACDLRIHRVADRSSGFPGATPAFDAMEQAFLRRCDVVVTSSAELQSGFAHDGIDTLLIENGVDLAHLRTPASRPAEYAEIAGPIAVYLGATEPWVDLDLVVASAHAAPDATVVVIGPQPSASNWPSNVRLLGPQPRSAVPALLQHADVGLVPFRHDAFPALVHGINPLKLYEYAAAGLPVIATPIPGAGAAQALAHVASTREDFVALVARGLRGELPRASSATTLDAFDWSARLQPLFERIERRLAQRPKT